MTVRTLPVVCRQGVIDVPIYGRIATLKLFRPPVSVQQAVMHHAVFLLLTQKQVDAAAAIFQRAATGRDEGPAVCVDRAV